MKLNLTINEAVALNNALYFAINNLKDAPLTLGLRLAYNAKQLEPIISSFEDVKKKALEVYGERDEDGQLKVENNQFVLTDQEAFNGMLKDALEEKFDVEMKELTVEVFPEKIDAAVIAGLYKIIVE